MPDVDPNGLSAKAPGAKLDAGKSPVFRGFVQYFPRAIRLVSSVSGFGAEKYSWGGWAAVPDGINRYTDALGRHLTAEQIDGPTDPETGLPHAAQVAWNAMARLELMLMKQEQPTVEVKEGPYCENCDELAEYRQDQGKVFKPLYWCEYCANVKLLDFDKLTRMGTL